MKEKLAKEPHTVVAMHEGAPVTLKQLFDRLKLSAYDLSIDKPDSEARAGVGSVTIREFTMPRLACLCSAC